MNHGEQLLRGSGVAQQVALPQKPYQWNGRAGWDPAKLGPMPTREQERAAKAERFARLREAGMSVPEVASVLDMGPENARWYERRRRAAGAQ